MNSGNQSAVDYFLQLDNPGVGDITHDHVVEALDLHDLIAKQEQSRRLDDIAAPVHTGIAIDWKPFIAAFHRLATQQCPTWRAYTNILNGDLLLRLAGNEVTLENFLVCRKDDEIFGGLVAHFHNVDDADFLDPKRISNGIMKLVIDDMLADYRRAERRGIEAMKKAKESEAVAKVQQEILEANKKKHLAGDARFDSNGYVRANTYEGVNRKVQTPQPSPTSLNPVFRVGDEVEWNVVGTRVDHGIIEEIDDVSKTASRIKLANGLWAWGPLSALRHRAKPAEQKPKFKNGDIVTGKAANTDHIVTGEINSAWDPPILIHGELQYCVKERWGDWWYCNEKDLKLDGPTKFKIGDRVCWKSDKGSMSHRGVIKGLYPGGHANVMNDNGTFFGRHVSELTPEPPKMEIGVALASPIPAGGLTPGDEIAVRMAAMDGNQTLPSMSTEKVRKLARLM